MPRRPKPPFPAKAKMHNPGTMKQKCEASYVCAQQRERGEDIDIDRIR